MSEQLCPELKAIQRLVPLSWSNSVYSILLPTCIVYLTAKWWSFSPLSLCPSPWNLLLFPFHPSLSASWNQEIGWARVSSQDPSSRKTSLTRHTYGSPCSTYQLSPVVCFVAHSLLSPVSWYLSPGRTHVFYFSVSSEYLALCLFVQRLLH